MQVGREPHKENDPNSEPKLSKPKLTAELYMRKQCTTDTDICNNKGESQSIMLREKESDTKTCLYIGKSRKDQTVVTQSRSVVDWF